MNQYTHEEVVDVFLDHIRYLAIVHHVTGRIRVKAGWDAVKTLAKTGTSEIERVIGMIPGIHDYRVNKKALSVVIEYDPAVLPFSLWEDVGRLKDYPLHRDEVRERLLAILQGDKGGE